MVEWLNEIIIPLIQVTFLLGLGSVLLFFVGRGLYRLYAVNIKWIVLYKIFRRQYNPDDIEYVNQALEKGMKESNVTTELLINGMNMNKIREIRYVFRQFYPEYQKSLKGE